MTLHFVTVIGITVLVSVIVLRRYAAGVREGMLSHGVVDLVEAPCPPLERTAPLVVVEADPATSTAPIVRTAILRERVARRWVIAAYLLSTGACGMVVSAVIMSIDGIEITSSRMVALTGAMMGAGVPMIAVSVAWPFWRALLIWVVLEFAVALLAVVLPMVRNLLRHVEFDPTLAMNALFLFQWTAVSLTLPFALTFVTGIRKLRGVAPMTLALMSVLGLVPLLGSNGVDRLGSAENVLVQFYGTRIVIYASFFVLAPAAGWVAWRMLKALSSAYEAKRFSDAQLIANVWWMIFVATLVAPLSVEEKGLWWVLLLAGTTSFALLPMLSVAVLSIRTRGDAHEPRPTLLLLRLFGHTARSEQFFDHVVGRWRLLGPVMAIGAPDIMARTFDPVDFLQIVTGRMGQSFIGSQQHLDRGLAALDLRPDPDGRYRVSEFWCRANSWQATVTALMSRCDAVVVDVRGLTAGRKGVLFELEQLASRVPADRVVLVVNKETDRDLIERSVATASGTIRLVRVERNSASETRRVFETLLEAAGDGRNLPSWPGTV